MTLAIVGMGMIIMWQRERLEDKDIEIKVWKERCEWLEENDGDVDWTRVSG